MLNIPKMQIGSAEIIAVGTEILFAQIKNTNADFLAFSLRNLGINCYYQTVVGDNKLRLENILDLAISRSDVIFLTGGLGPTPDDITMEIAAKVSQKKLVFHEEIAEQIRTYFASTGRTMPDSNLKQAYFPEGSFILPNHNGTAPGCLIPFETGGKERAIVLLPGPPHENIPMFNTYVKSFLEDSSPYIFETTILNLIGLGESHLIEKIASYLDDKQVNPSVAPYASLGYVKIRVTYKHERGSSIETYNKVLAELRSILKEYIFSENDESMAETLVSLLSNKKKSVSTIESCTVGNIVRLLGEVPGASAVLKGGIVSYQDKIKEKLLEISDDKIRKYGAISEEVALDMAINGLKRFDSDYCIATSGNAGPSVAEDKELGLVYIAIASKEKTICKAYHFTGNRDKIISLTSLNALNLLRELLIEQNNY